MDVQLKQRLFLAIVILALIVIFVPMLFNKHEREKIATIQAIPTPPSKPMVRQVPISIPAQEQQEEHIVPQSEQPKQVQTQQAVSMVPAKKLAASTPAPIPKINAASAKLAQPAAQIIPAAQVAPAPIIRRAHILQARSNRYRHVIKSIPINQPLKVAQFKLAPNLPSHFNIRTSNASSVNVRQHLTAAQQTRLAVAKSYDKAWVIQLGSFSNEENANKLIHTLRAKGLTAFGYKFNKNGQVMTRVYIGPTLKQDAAQKALKDVEDLVHMKGIIMPFDATKLR